MVNELLKNEGLLCFIIPNTIITQEYYAYTRKYLINDVTLIEVIGFPELPFEDAVVETVIILFQKVIKEFYKIRSGVLSNERFQIVSENINTFIKNESSYVLSFNQDTILNKVLNHDYVSFEEVCNINQAIALKGDKSLSLKSDNPNGKFYKLLDGRNINKYSINWEGVYLEYDINRIHSCKKKDIFETGEKLLFRRVSSSLIFTYDDSQYFALNTLVVINLREYLKGFSLKFILGLMNSKVMDYVYRKKHKSTKTIFSEIQARSVGKLPIPKVEPSQSKTIITLVNQILLQKKSDSTADTSALEAEIDRLVYELYGLTEEEIRIVEGVKA